MKPINCLLHILWGMLPLVVAAADHADPMFHAGHKHEANLTGLFFFPDGDNYVVILNTRPNTTASTPFELDRYEFAIHLDLNADIKFAKDENGLRYGGDLKNPHHLQADAVVKLRLNNDGSLKSRQLTGLNQDEPVKIYSGVRDDPFIFPRFFGKNVVSMVVSIPRSAFSEQQTSFAVWGTSSSIKSGHQIDHVGRANRTQLARLNFLNEHPPSQHLQALDKRDKSISRVQNVLDEYLPTVASLNQYAGFVIRSYDHMADVLIYDVSSPAAFPNGRRLTDDVAVLTCALGDCPLIEVAYTEGDWPRATQNDKPFLPHFPYLASAWPQAPELQQPSLFWAVLRFALLSFVIFIILLQLVRRLSSKRQKRLQNL